MVYASISMTPASDKINRLLFHLMYFILKPRQKQCSYSTALTWELTSANERCSDNSVEVVLALFAECMKEISFEYKQNKRVLLQNLHKG